MITFTCNAVPVQAEGWLPDGRMWYFHARHGYWSFCISRLPTKSYSVLFNDCSYINEGSDPFNGWGTHESAIMWIQESLRIANDLKDGYLRKADWMPCGSCGEPTYYIWKNNHWIYPPECLVCEV